MIPPPPDAPTVWYAAYGSNMCAARLRCYLAGGTPPGARRTYLGCRDQRPPRRTTPVTLPGGTYFALTSAAWTGGVALYDPTLPGHTPARGYLLTAAQFADLLAQERYRPTGSVTDTVVADAVRHGRIHLGPGRYDTVVHTGHHDGRPVLTFTAAWRAADVAPHPPAPAYLATIAAGLHESHGWTADRITAHLAARPGIAGRWSPTHLRAVVASALAPP